MEFWLLGRGDPPNASVKLSEVQSTHNLTWGSPKSSDTFGGPITRTIVVWGLYWGSPSLGELPHSPALAGFHKKHLGYT